MLLELCIIPVAPSKQGAEKRAVPSTQWDPATAWMPPAQIRGAEGSRLRFPCEPLGPLFCSSSLPSPPKSTHLTGQLQDLGSMKRGMGSWSSILTIGVPSRTRDWFLVDVGSCAAARRRAFWLAAVAVLVMRNHQHFRSDRHRTKREIPHDPGYSNS